MQLISMRAGFNSKVTSTKHLDLKGSLMSGTLCKTNLGLRVLKRRPLASLLMPCYRPRFLVALNKSVLLLGSPVDLRFDQEQIATETSS